MSEIKQGLRAILEGNAVAQGGEIRFPQRDVSDPGGMDDQMIMETAALSDFLFTESILFGEELPLNEAASVDSVTFAQIIKEMTEEEIRADIEKKRTLWQKVKEKFKRFLDGPFDPYGGLTELKAVNELLRDKKTGVYTAIQYPFIGFVITLINLARKYNNFPKDLAVQYIKEAKEHRNHLEKIANNLEKETDKKYKNAAKRVKRQIVVLDNAIEAFERRALDKAII